MNRTTKNSKENAYDQIQELILGMDIKPGETITEIALSNLLGIGRTPVREALKKLEQEGLVITTNRRKRVYVLTVKELEEIFDIKICLESNVAYEAAKKIKNPEINALKKILEEMKVASEIEVNNEADEQRRLKSWMAADRKLHHMLFTLAGNSKIEQIIRNLDLQWQRLRLGIYTLEGRIQRSYGEHADVVNAVIAKTPKEASKAMKLHLGDVKAELIKLFKMFHYPIE